MAKVLRNLLPIGSSKTSDKEDDDSNFEYSYSFAAVYSGPLITHDIPRAVPVDVKQIPIAAKIVTEPVLSDLALPVIQPVAVRSRLSDKRPPKVWKFGKNGISDSGGDVRRELDRMGESNCVNDDGQCRWSLSNGSGSSGGVEFVNGDECVPGSSNGRGSSSRLGRGKSDDCGPSSSNGRGGSSSREFANGNGCRSSLSDRIQSYDDVCDDSREISKGLQGPEVSISGDEDAGRDFEGYMNPTNGDSVESDLSSNSVSSEIFSEREGDHIEEEESPCHARKPSVTFLEPATRDEDEDESDQSDFESEFPERPVADRPGKKGTCYRCSRGNRFTEKEVCIVCGAKYCSKCVLRAMGSMPEGRKCVSCIGHRIDEAKRMNLGKCSRMLKHLLPKLEVKQIMKSEKTCEVNQLPPELVFVNGLPLSQEELFLLQKCSNPPKRLTPGRYWYDRTAGFWGEEGDKPCQIITPKLTIGGVIESNASNGDTKVKINNRTITSIELMMLKLLGVKCEGEHHFWLSPDGTYVDEGMNNQKESIWKKRRAKLICAALSLPTPPDHVNESSDQEASVVPPSLRHKALYKLLLVGYAKSGTSTMFKQTKIIHNIPFSEDERLNIKSMIQSNLYGYFGLLLEARERFEEESLVRKKRHSLDPCSSSDQSHLVKKDTIYGISPKLKAFSDWLLKVMVAGNLEAIFPAATREYAPFLAELWNDAAIQATYSRRKELESLPRVATYFLERAVEIARAEYEPSDMDLLYAEGITSSKGLNSLEFSFLDPPQDSCDHNEQDSSVPSLSCRYQLIRVHPKVLGGNCKWLEMFEDVDMVLFCVSLTDYDEFIVDSHGFRINKMMASKQLFESIVTHPMFENKKFLLILNKFDLLEEKIEQVPLTQCEWFHDFNPVIGHNPNSCTSSIVASTNTPLAHRAFQYVAVKFKRLFSNLTYNKLFVSLTTALEPENVDEALKYAREVLHWKLEDPIDYSSSSIEASSTTC